MKKFFFQKYIYLFLLKTVELDDNLFKTKIKENGLIIERDDCKGM